MTAHFSWQAGVIGSELESTTKLVLLVIGARMNQHGGGAFPSYATIAADASLNRSTVIKHVDVAVSAGWIKKVARMRPSKEDGRPEADSNLYAVSFPVVDESDHLGAENGHQVGDADHRDLPEQPPVVGQDDSNTPTTTPQLPPQFIEAWEAYPKRAGGNSRKEALKAWLARIKAGVDPVVMVAGVKRYAEFIRATGKEGTEYVKQGASFFGPSEHYLEPWTPPRQARGGQPTTFKDSTYTETPDDEIPWLRAS